MSEAPSAPPVRLLYIMGAGHSGSTILGIALGNCEGFCFAGELEEFLVGPGLPAWGSEERTAFWAAVGAQVGDTAQLRRRANRYIERSSVVLRPDLWAQRRRMLGDYRRVAGELVRAVADAAGADYVVDSSHFPLRVRELRRLEGIEVYLLYLVRDPQEVVDSNLRELSRHEVAERRLRALSMNGDLTATQLMSMAAFLTHPRARRRFLRHEDFIAEPATVLGELLAWVGSPAAVPDLTRLRPGIALQGNKIIRSETLALRAATARRRRRSLLTALAQAPWWWLLRLLGPSVGGRG